MKSGLLTLCFSLAISVCACAQRAITWQPDSALRVGGKVAYTRVIVEDVRSNKDNIGWIKTGALNRYADLVMDTPLSTSLAGYATHLLRGAETSQGVLLVVLRDFRVEDRKGGEEIGTVHVRADLFWGGDTGSEIFFHLRPYDTLYETKSGWDVTKAVQALASQAIFDMLSVAAAAQTVPVSGAQQIFRPNEAAGREAEAKQRWPLYTVAQPPRGIYYNLDDLLNLRTTDTNFIDVKVASPDAPPKWYFYRRNSRGKKGKRIEPSDCLAIYDGTLWHIARGSGFTRMKREGDDFYATLYLLGLSDNTAIMPMFGLVGVGVMVMTSPGNNKSYTPYRTRLAPELNRFVPERRAR